MSTAAAPDEYIAADITELCGRLGADLTVVGHHYQSDKVIRHCLIRGDSLELARKVEGIPSRYIVFCGVYFMGESAALLAAPHQSVYIPDHNADCVLSLTSPAGLVDKILTKLTASGRKLTPLAYVNTSLELKAVVGKHGGSVCTSANASRMFDWARKQGDGVFFLPDKNLARNTAYAAGLRDSDLYELDIRRGGEAVDLAAANKAEVLLWPGCCAVHARFTPAHVAAARAATPGCSVIVHPECSPEVAAVADAAGSTSAIIDYVRNMPDGGTVYVGTEINLVRRLAAEQEGRVSVVPLRVSSCSHMGKVTPAKLRDTLEKICRNEGAPVQISEDTAAPAREALERMLKVCS